MHSSKQLTALHAAPFLPVASAFIVEAIRMNCCCKKLKQMTALMRFQFCSFVVKISLAVSFRSTFSSNK